MSLMKSSSDRIGCLRCIGYSIISSIALLLTGCGCTVEIQEDTSVPQWCKKVLPGYPRAARRANAEGTVILEATVDVDGKARNIEVKEDNVGYGCARAAIEALKDSRFIPAEQDGEPIPMRISIPYRFVLVD